VGYISTREQFQRLQLRRTREKDKGREGKKEKGNC
jgi:hypothetical protein